MVWRLQQRALSQYLLWLVFVFFLLRICFSGYFWPKCLGIWVRLARHSLELLSLITWRSSRPAEHKLCSAFRNSGMSNRNLFMNLYFSPFSLNLFVFKIIAVSQNSWWQMIPKLQNQISLRALEYKVWIKKDRLTPTYQDGTYNGRRKWAKKSFETYFRLICLVPRPGSICPKTTYMLTSDKATLIGEL